MKAIIARKDDLAKEKIPFKQILNQRKPKRTNMIGKFLKVIQEKLLAEGTLKLRDEQLSSSEATIKSLQGELTRYFLSRDQLEPFNWKALHSSKASHPQTWHAADRIAWSFEYIAMFKVGCWGESSRKESALWAFSSILCGESDGETTDKWY